jgi:hypothetical protein
MEPLVQDFIEWQELQVTRAKLAHLQALLQRFLDGDEPSDDEIKAALERTQ